MTPFTIATHPANTVVTGAGSGTLQATAILAARQGLQVATRDIDAAGTHFCWELERAIAAARAYDMTPAGGDGGVMGVVGLPNGNRAIVAPTKITHYLLDDGHPDGGPKSRFLRSFGFDPASPGVLKDALLAHPMTHDVSATHLVEQGEVFEVTGPMLAPDGRLPMIRTVWIILKGETDPRFVTLKPVWR